AKDRAVGLPEVAAELLRVDARHRDVRADPVDRDHGGREQQPAAELRDPPRAEQRRQHQASPASSGQAVSSTAPLSSPASASPPRSGAATGPPCAAPAADCPSSPASSVTPPPAATSFSRALAENACAVTWSGPESSPTPSTLTGSRRLRRTPAASMEAGVTS